MVILLRRSAGTSSITTCVPAVLRREPQRDVRDRKRPRLDAHLQDTPGRVDASTMVVVAQERQRPEALGVLEAREPGAGHAGSAAWIAREPTTQWP